MQRSTRQLVIAALVSLVVHVLLGALAVGLILMLAKPEPPKIFDVSLVTPPPSTAHKPVVNTPKPDEEKRPDKANYFAEHDQSVEKETRASLTGPTQSPSESSRQQRATFSRPSSAPQRSAPEQSAQPQPKSVEQAEKDGWKKPAQRLQDRLLPKWQNMAPSADSAAFNDDLPRVAQDAKTRLNTWQWKHATFFVRLKQAISQRWNPRRAIARNDPEGDMFGGKNRVTVLKVSIDQEGNLQDLSVANRSGVYYLDEEAISAFQAAAPFANPPLELFEGRSVFQFTFSFLVSIERGLSFDTDWNPS